MKKKNTWNVRRLVDDSFVPSAQQTSVLKIVGVQNRSSQPFQHSSSVLFHSCIQADRKLCSSLPQQLVFLFWFPMLLSQFTAWGNLSQPQAKALAAFPKNKAISKIAKLCNYGFCVLDCQTFLDKEIKKIENSKAHCTRAFSKSRIIWRKDTFPLLICSTYFIFEK